MEDSGAFSLTYNGTGKVVDFFSPNDDYSSTYFTARINNIVYNLSRSSSADISTFYHESGGAGIKYVLQGGETEVLLIFTFCPEFDGLSQSVIKVEVVVNNNSAEGQAVDLKAVFDTMLGESSGNHFSTQRTSLISNEVGFSSMEADRWIKSTDGKSSVQFLLCGAGITVPQAVTLANKDILSGSAWFSSAKTGRSFNSVFSYNNSAVGLLWNTISVAPMTKSSICFYISCAVAGNQPADASFLGAETSASSLLNTDEVVYQDEYGVTHTMGALTTEQLDPRYIEDLLNRIRQLESNPENVDRNEILQLNAELDAILEKIRRM